MPRTARASVGGLCYHVINRGNGRARVFRRDGDYAAFERVMHDACGPVPLRVLAYCLLPNHFHLVLWPRGDGDLSRWMQRMTTAHVRATTRIGGRVATSGRAGSKGQTGRVQLSGGHVASQHPDDRIPLRR